VFEISMRFYKALFTSVFEGKKSQIG